MREYFYGIITTLVIVFGIWFVVSAFTPRKIQHDYTRTITVDDSAKIEQAISNACFDV